MKPFPWKLHSLNDILFAQYANGDSIVNEEKQQKSVNFKLDEAIHKQLRHLALDQSQTFQDFVKTVLTEKAQQVFKHESN